MYTVYTENGLVNQGNTDHMILAAFFKWNIDQTIDTAKCDVHNIHGSVVLISF